MELEGIKSGERVHPRLTHLPLRRRVSTDTHHDLQGTTQSPQDFRYIRPTPLLQRCPYTSSTQLPPLLWPRKPQVRLALCTPTRLIPQNSLYALHDSFIDLANASAESLTALTEACDPATFGLGGEDVLDETYRKAAKLDASKFAITFDPVRCGLISAIKDQLLQGNVSKVSLDCELSKLNVYGISSSNTSPREPDLREKLT